MVGKTILIGVTYYDHAGKEQRGAVHGTITEAAKRKAIVVALRTTPTRASFLRSEWDTTAKPGEYRLVRQVKYR